MNLEEIAAGRGQIWVPWRNEELGVGFRPGVLTDDFMDAWRARDRDRAAKYAPDPDEDPDDPASVVATAERQFARAAEGARDTNQTLLALVSDWTLAATPADEATRTYLPVSLETLRRVPNGLKSQILIAIFSDTGEDDESPEERPSAAGSSVRLLRKRARRKR